MSYEKSKRSKERIYMEDLTEENIAIKTSNMPYPVPCLKDVPKNVAHTQKPDKRYKRHENTF